MAVGKIGVARGRVPMQASSGAAVAAAKNVRGGLYLRHATLAIGFSPHGTSNLTPDLTMC